MSLVTGTARPSAHQPSPDALIPITYAINNSGRWAHFDYQMSPQVSDAPVLEMTRSRHGASDNAGSQAKGVFASVGERVSTARRPTHETRVIDDHAFV
jgi:hypothetical protein